MGEIPSMGEGRKGRGIGEGRTSYEERKDEPYNEMNDKLWERKVEL